ERVRERVAHRRETRAGFADRLIEVGGVLPGLGARRRGVLGALRPLGRCLGGAERHLAESGGDAAQAAGGLADALQRCRDALELAAAVLADARDRLADLAEAVEPFLQALAELAEGLGERLDRRTDAGHGRLGLVCAPAGAARIDGDADLKVAVRHGRPPSAARKIIGWSKDAPGES